MTSPPAKKLKSDDKSDSVCGFVHNVSPLKTSVKSSKKYFNAVLQVDRDEFHDVVVFAAEKHSSFVQANKNESPVKLKKFKRGVSMRGDGYDIQCGNHTDISVVEKVSFVSKVPPLKLKTIREVKQMAPKQNVAVVKVKVLHVGSDTETVEIRGVPMDMQTCFIADESDYIKLQLWDKQLGALDSGRSYQITNLSTRDFGGALYLTATRSTEMLRVADLSGVRSDLPLKIDEQGTTLIASISGAEVTIRCCCGKCHAWQEDFDGKGKYHRCVRCKLLQNVQSFQPSASAKISVAGESGEDDLKLSNVVLRSYLQENGLLKMLSDAQAIEEHLLEMGTCCFKIRNNVVTSLCQRKPESQSEPECADLLGGDAEGDVGWFDECGDMGK